MKHLNKQHLFMIGAAVFAVLFLFSGVMACQQYADRKQSAEAFDSIAALVQTEPTVPEESDAAAETGTTEENEPAGPSAYETYSEVYAQNQDFAGWIKIEGTSIDYPVMQTPDNPDFYLKRGFDKAYSAYGVPYAQENCVLGQSDNVVIYGHHMNDGSMFADLCRYTDQDFYEQHKTIRFDTLSEFGEYEIVAVFKTAAYSEEGFKYYHFVDGNEEDFDNYIAKCRAMSLYDTGVAAEYGDKLITLSTCEYSRTNGRMVVVAKKIASPSGEVSPDA